MKFDEEKISMCFCVLSIEKLFWDGVIKTEREGEGSKGQKQKIFIGLWIIITLLKLIDLYYY